MAHNRKPAQEWLSGEESASPTTSMEGTFPTAPIDAWGHRDVMMSNTQNAFMQAKLNGEKR